MSDPILHLPKNLQAAARKLPPEKAHTVLELKEEGEGHNASLISVATICYKMGVSYEDTIEHLETIYSSERIDYRTAPRRAVNRIWEGEGELVTDEESEVAYLPDAQEEFLLRFRRTPNSTLLESSPHKTNIKPLGIVKHLFEKDEIINVQHTAFEHGTLLNVSSLYEVGERWDELRDSFHSFKFLNPATFRKVEGVPNPLDPDKKIATRCNANVKARPFMVLEMDSKDESKVERFTTFALSLAQFAPLVLAVDTGNKSIHFWFDARNATAFLVAHVFGVARLHGADKALGVRSQIARMPNVSTAAEGRGAQRVLYFDPNRENCPSGESWDIKGFDQYIQRAKQLDYYYEGDSGKYFMQDNINRWTRLNRTSLIAQLARQGFRVQKSETELISPVDELIAGIEMDKSIELVLKGASGKHSGYYEENGFRFLVLKSPHFIKPRKGSWDTIRNFLYHMLSTDPLQVDILFGWMASSMKDLRNGGRREAIYAPAQMLHFIGPKNAGKTLFLEYILPHCFGGRSASADDLFADRPSGFNSDSFQAEICHLDDTEVLSTDYASRAKHGERIKSHTVGAGGMYHAKNRDRVNIRPWRRFVRMMNEEPQILATLPPLESGVDDKVIIFHTRSMEGGKINMEPIHWFDGVRDAIAEELPAFIHHLLEEYRTPEEALDPERRYAVRSYKNKAIMDVIEIDSPEFYILHKFEGDAAMTMFSDLGDDLENVSRPYWEGTSNELYDLLADVGSRNAQMRFRKVCGSPKVLTSQLKSLEKSHPERIQYSNRADLGRKKVNGAYFWRVNRVRIEELLEEDEPCF